MIQNKNIQNNIFKIRDKYVMLDSDLATLYGVELKRLNEQVKRNIERFPDSFRFQISKDELASLSIHNLDFNNNSILRSQIATSSSHGGRRYLPFVFTEQGVSMLSAVLRSETAIKVSIAIINAFVEMRKYISLNTLILNRLDNVEIKQLETDRKFENVLKALEVNQIEPKQGIFYDGQVFDAYTFVADLVRSAKKSIVLIDNYVDDSVLTLFSKKKPSVKCSIYTKTISKQLKLDIEKFEVQYGKIKIQQFNKSHDRFLIIDNKIIYHFGASLKDLGKKWFAFSKMDGEFIKFVNFIK